MAVIGCDIPVARVSGAEELANKTGIWVKTNFFEKDNFLYARTFCVAAGEPLVFEFRIDLRPLEKIAAKVHERLHQKMNGAVRGTPDDLDVDAAVSGSPGDLDFDGAVRGSPGDLDLVGATPGDLDLVGFSFSKAFKSIKKTAKKIGKSKLVKAVGGAVKAVAKSKIVGALATGLAVAVPVVGVPALAAYGAAKAAIGAVDKGRKLAHTASTAQRVIAKGGKTAKKVVSVKAATPQLQASVQAKAMAQAKAQAAAIAKNARATAARAPAQSTAIQAAAAAKAKAVLAQGQRKAAAAKTAVAQQVATATAKVAPAVAAAAQLKAKLADPKVQAQLLTIKKQADSAKNVLSDIQQKAKFGTGEEKLDAQKSAAIVNLVAQNQKRLEAISQVHAGGLPAILIDGKGRLIRGNYRVVAKTGGKNPDVLYKGPKKATESGAFAKVSGASIGASKHYPMRPYEVESYQPGGGWQPHGRARDQAEYTRSLADFAQRGILARVVDITSGRKIASNSNALVNARKPRVGASSPRPFPPLSPSEKQKREQLIAAFLAQKGKRARVGAVIGCGPGSPPGMRGALGPSSIGCDCEGSQF